MQNEQRSKLGVPLPQGSVALFEEQAGRPLLIGETRLTDKAVGEEVELVFSESPAVRWSSVSVASGDKWRDMRATATNANPRPVRFELRVQLGDGERFERASAKLVQKEGTWLWNVTIPSNSSATLNYRVKYPS
jgi:hypothetical protein